MKIRLHDKDFVPYLSETEIDKAVTSIADQINKNFQDKKPLFLAVLNGSFMFTSDLMKKIEIDCELSFVKLASYHGTQSSGEIKELIGLSDNIYNRHVIILEDIVDTGTTLGHLMEVLKTHDTASISIATLLLKPDVFKKKYPLHFVGMEIPNKFVVGYGLDYNESGRNLKAIYQLEE
ncbi:MAG: hypoxanthine phosphoribosyltransferase [Crocinitomicaceae bacterium]|nr:hypoxanthine phosphoribosyltransferase [Crocinitomicaceae bacterium]